MAVGGDGVMDVSEDGVMDVGGDGMMGDGNYELIVRGLDGMMTPNIAWRDSSIIC